MFVCRLFDRDRPFEQIDVRLLTEGQLSVGRDPAADWRLDDPQGTLSRIHFTLTVENGALTLTDCSTNGTFLGSGERAPRDIPVPVAPRETLRFGALSLLVDQPEMDESALDHTQIMPISRPAPVPRDWLDGGGAPTPHHRDESLIEAFCEGARLDSSSFSGEDPAEMMRRLGAIYQQTVLGLATLLAERTRFKSDHQLDRTTIGSQDNNPFKWSPTRRLATSLLCTHEQGFLSDAEAVRASFDDVTRHLAGIMSGGNAALRAVIDWLSPDAIEAEVNEAGFSLRGRAATCRTIHERRHAALAQDDRHLVARAFAAAYLRAAEQEANP